eukprot:PhM_4_TR3501/c1_g2_i1/m.39214/K09584/PDIA6, TXNDC7; protein disulfide-isomerase A6
MKSFIGILLSLLMLSLTTVSSSPLPYPDGHDHIVNLNHDNFKQHVMETDAIWIIEFYAPWCGHCKAFTPEYEKAAKSLAGIVKFGAVNGDDQNAAGIAQAFGVQGYPTIKLFPSELTKHEKEGTFSKVPIDYQGERSAAALVRWVLSRMPTQHIERITGAESHKAFLDRFADDSLPKVMLFTNKKHIAPLYTSLSLDFKYRALFGVVQQSDETAALQKKYAVKKFPTIVLVTDDETQTFNGDINKDELVAFVEPHALPASSRPQMMAKVMEEEEAAKKKAELEKRLANAPKPRVLKSDEEWRSLCLDRVVGMCAVAMLDPNDSGYERQLEALEEAATVLPTKSSVSMQIVILDGPTNFEIANFFENNNGYPSLVFVHPKRERFVNFIGAFNVDGIVSFAQTKAIKSSGHAYKASEAPALVEPLVDEE